MIHLNSRQKENILKLLEIGVSVKDCLKYTMSSEVAYRNSRESDTFFIKQVDMSKKRGLNKRKEMFLGVLSRQKGAINTSCDIFDIDSKTVRKWRVEDYIFDNEVKSIVLKFNHSQTFKSRNPSGLDENIRYKIKKGKLVQVFCISCYKAKPPEHFHRNSNNPHDVNIYCIKCVGNKRGRRLRRSGSYDYKNDRPRYIYNSNGNLIKRICNECENMLPIVDFPKLYLNVPYCKDCFDPSLQRHKDYQKEFKIKGNKQIRVRWYDDNGDIIKKRCSTCGIGKSIDEFSRNRSNRYDGRTNSCKKCDKKYRELRKNLI